MESVAPGKGSGARRERGREGNGTAARESLFLLRISGTLSREWVKNPLRIAEEGRGSLHGPVDW